MSKPTDAQSADADRDLHESPASPSDPVANDEDRACPECGGTIRFDDVICPHCGLPLVGG